MLTCDERVRHCKYLEWMCDVKKSKSGALASVLQDASLQLS